MRYELPPWLVNDMDDERCDGETKQWYRQTIDKLNEDYDQVHIDVNNDLTNLFAKVEVLETQVKDLSDNENTFSENLKALQDHMMAAEDNIMLNENRLDAIEKQVDDMCENEFWCTAEHKACTGSPRKTAAEICDRLKALEKLHTNDGGMLHWEATRISEPHTDTEQKSEGYWWCPECEVRVSYIDVTGKKPRHWTTSSIYHDIERRTR